MMGKWDNWYNGIKQMGSFRYGNTKTYQLAADFLQGLEVEDWGCGTGGFKRLHSGKYIGLDGSQTPFVDKLVDLRDYRSSVEGIMMRHILEHNYDWNKVLGNALASFQKRFCLIIFTPFQEVTKEIAHNEKHGVDVPDIGFNKEELDHYFLGLKWRMETIKTRTAYGIEHIYFIER
jgi:hypothetical protein